MGAPSFAQSLQRLLVRLPAERLRRAAGVTMLFVLLTAVMTWPQARLFGTHALDDGDVFFNLWRLSWIAHALSTSPRDLFNGNVFYPERGVLAYSDAMLVEGVIASPLLWAGVPPVLVHNLMLLGPIVASAVGIFFLARHLTGSTAGAAFAGIVFAFAPYRFDHYHHMELQWTVWAPWAFWALQRLVETGSIRFGLLIGLLAGLQTASSVYYGVFLAVLIAPVALVQLLVLRGRHLARVVAGLLLAGTIAASLSALYLLPYSQASERVGMRTKYDSTFFSARPRDYRMPTPTNLLYATPGGGVPERRLFPGILPPLLALTGLLLVRPTTAAIAYVVGLVTAFELSLGFFGQLYPFLYEHVLIFHGLRVPARASIFALLFLGLLAAYGIASLTAALRRPLRQAIAVGACGILLLEYWVAPLTLVEFHNEAPPLYVLLSRLPRGVVAEFPMPEPDPPRHDPRFAYMSTFHWQQLVNGYSGFYPRSYLRRIRALAKFPDANSVAVLRREGVKYVVVHADGYPPGERTRIVERLIELGLTPVGDYEDGWSIGTVMQLQ